MTDNTHDYLVIADNEVQREFSEHVDAQEYARDFSQGRYDTAKVIYLPNRTLQGHWFKGERIQ